jgi:hypothetical protein
MPGIVHFDGSIGPSATLLIYAIDSGTIDNISSSRMALHSGDVFALALIILSSAPNF